MFLAISGASQSVSSSVLQMKNLEVARGKKITYKEIIGKTNDFSSVIIKARRQWENASKVLRKNICQPIIVYPAKLSSENESELSPLQTKSVYCQEFHTKGTSKVCTLRKKRNPER